MISQIFHRVAFPGAKQRAVKSYLVNLPAALQRRYGKAEQYTPQQVRRTLQQSRLNQRFVEYAYLLYCGEQYLLEQGAGQTQVDELNDYLAEIQHSLPPAHNGIDQRPPDSGITDFGLPDGGGLGDS